MPYLSIQFYRIVEDNPVDYILIAHTLKETCRVIDWCKYANVALEKVKLNKYDVIILDFILPEFDGIELLRCIRQIGITTPAIFVSGIEDKEHIKKAMAAGAKCFINKRLIIKEKNSLIQCVKDINFTHISHIDDDNL